MLVLKRKKLERIRVTHAGQTLEIFVSEIDRGCVRLGFDGPIEFRIERAELSQAEPISAGGPER